MNEKHKINTVNFIETALETLREMGKSQDIADLLIELDNPVGLLNDIIIELALAAKPTEEIGAGCKSYDEIAKMLEEYKAI